MKNLILCCAFAACIVACKSNSTKSVSDSDAANMPKAECCTKGADAAMKGDCAATKSGCSDKAAACTAKPQG